MAAALLVLTVGGIMVFSAIRGHSITDILNGIAGFPTDQFDPASVNTFDPASSSGSSPITSQVGGATPFAGSVQCGSIAFPSGPQAALLRALAGAAQNTFHLTITSTCSGNHVPGSYHFKGEAFDASGSEANMRAFASYIANTPLYANSVSELIHNPGFAIKDGKPVNGPVFYSAVWLGHKNHVHVAAG